MRCSQCGSEVLGSSDADVVECPFCTATSLLPPAESDHSAGESKRLVRNRAVDLSRFTIDVDGPNLEIRWNWDWLNSLMVLPVVVVLSWFAALSAPDWKTLGDTDSTSLLFALVLIVAAMGLGYTALAMLFNRTQASIHDGLLSTSHGPLPYYLAKRLTLSQLDELVVHRKVTESSNNNRPEIEYELHARTTAGRTIKLIIHEQTPAVPDAVKAVLDAHISAQLAETLPHETTSAQSSIETHTPPSPERLSGRRNVLLICSQCGGLSPPPREITSSYCRYCKAELTIPDEVWNSVGLHAPRRRNIEHAPVSFVVRQEHDSLTISANWNRDGSGVVLAITSALMGIAIACLLLTLRSIEWSFVALMQGRPFIVAVAITMIGFIVGWIGYWALCHFINRSVVTLTSAQLRVWNGPLPLIRNSQLPTDKITQISIHRNYRVYSRDQSPRYDLDAISDYGATLQLISQQSDLRGLETVERLLEQRMGLADRMVKGQV